jgi:integrase
MKRANGTGSIYKLSGKRRKPFAAVATVGWDDDGNIKRHTVGYFAKRIEAEEALSRYLNNPTEKHDITLEALYYEWKEWKYKTIGRKTVENYEIAWKKIEELGDLKVKQIRTAQLQRCIDNHNHLSYSSLSKIRVLSVMLWDHANENDIVDKNYAKFIKLPKAEANSRDAFTEIELAKIEKAAFSGNETAETVLALCYTGFRINELLGLTPFCYDSENKTLQGGLKTAAGKDRVVPIHPKIQRYVDVWAAKKGDYIFCSPKGKKLSDNNYRNKFYYPLLESLGVRKLSPHCCRHTFASLCERAEISAVKIEKLIGHTDYKMTKKYTHTELSELRKAIEKLS